MTRNGKSLGYVLCGGIAAAAGAALWPPLQLLLCRLFCQ